MDPTSLFFLILMVAFTGLMAFAGDTLGRHLGKKRVRLGKLRPKHTAALLTAGAGSLGAALVVLVLMGISEPVRVWILSGSQVRAELENVQSELNSLKTERRKLDLELKATGTRLVQEAKRTAQSEKRNLALQNRNTALASTSERLQAEIKNKASDAARLRTSVAAERKRLSEARNLLTAVRTQFELEKQGAATIRQDNSKIQARNLELTQANLELEKQKEDLEASSKALAAKTAELQDAIQALQRTFDSTSAEQKELLRASQSQLTQSQTELEQTTSLLAQIRNDLQALERERFALLGLSEASRQKPMVMERLDELSRVPVPANSTLAEARSLVAAAVARAEATALNRGSGVSSLSRSTVVFVDIRRQGQPPVTSEMQKEALALELAGKPEDRVFILRALVNTFAGEPVALDAVIFRNPVVYQSGQVLGEARLDGRLDQEAIAERLETFVSETLAQNVMRAGIIPAKGTPQPLGELSRDSVLRIVQAVKQSGVTVRVQFMAATQTRAGDSLKISYRLR